ncbi:MAG: transporter substrate-binding domain-containing protein [Burkholderiales bacterium]|nr:transporter substrate-binding domain-containing protein [Burkholderiales bacterium]
MTPAELAPILAPQGTLRATINIGNPVLAAMPAGAAEPHGVSVDIARELASRLGVPVAFVICATAAKAVEAVKAGACDITFLAVDPARAVDIDYAAPYVVIEGAYMVKNDSPLTANAEVDRAGHRVAVGKGSAYDLFLTREIRQAELVRFASSQEVVDGFLAQGLDVAAGVKQQLEADARRLPGLRLLPGRFMEIRQAIGAPKGRGEAAVNYLYAFIEALKASGFIAAALARHGIAGAAVAPAGR